MAKISIGELKRVTAAAAKQQELLPTSFRPEQANNPKLRDAQRQVDGLLSELYRNAGLNTKEFEGAVKRHRAELQRVLAAEKAAAVKQARRVKTTVHSNVTSQAHALQELSAQSGFFPYPSYTLDKPILIVGRPRAGVLTESHIEPFNSWAKMRVQSHAEEDNDRATFFFMWQNPTAYYTVINATTFMSATGHMKAVATGGPSGIDPTSRFSYVGASANFALWPWWESSPAQPPYVTKSFGGTNVSASFWDKSATTNVSNGDQLSQTLFLVPPNGNVIFEVALTVSYYQGHGYMDADFDSGSFRITCPLVLVSVLTPPTMSVAE